MSQIDLPLYAHRFSYNIAPDEGYSVSPAYLGWVWSGSQWNHSHAWFRINWQLLSNSNIHDYMIISAELHVTTNAIPNAVDTAIHIVKPYVDLSYVTWNNYFTSTPWNTPGGTGMDTDIYPTPISTLRFTAATNTIAMTAAHIITLSASSRSLLFYSPTPPSDNHDNRMHYISTANMFIRVFYNPSGTVGDATMF